MGTEVGTECCPGIYFGRSIDKLSDFECSEVGTHALYWSKDSLTSGCLGYRYLESRSLFSKLKSLLS